MLVLAPKLRPPDINRPGPSPNFHVQGEEMTSDEPDSASAKRSQEIRPDVVPLKFGALCPECEVIHDTRLPCPYCGTAESISLKRVLGGTE